MKTRIHWNVELLFSSSHNHFDWRHEKEKKSVQPRQYMPRFDKENNYLDTPFISLFKSFTEDFGSFRHEDKI